MLPDGLSRKQKTAAKLGFLTLTILKENGGEVSSREIFEAVESRSTLDDWQKTPLGSGKEPRWKVILRSFTADCVKAGLLIKDRGSWRLTLAGSKAHAWGEAALLDHLREAKKHLETQEVTPGADRPRKRFTLSLDWKLIVSLASLLVAASVAIWQNVVVSRSIVVKAIGCGYDGEQLHVTVTITNQGNRPDEILSIVPDVELTSKSWRAGDSSGDKNVEQASNGMSIMRVYVDKGVTLTRRFGGKIPHEDMMRYFAEPGRHSTLKVNITVGFIGKKGTIETKRTMIGFIQYLPPSSMFTIDANGQKGPPRFKEGMFSACVENSTAVP